jgi:hypothetical protein
MHVIITNNKMEKTADIALLPLNHLNIYPTHHVSHRRQRGNLESEIKRYMLDEP